METIYSVMIYLCQQAHHGHEEATGDARHTVSQVVSLAQPDVDHSLYYDQCDHVGHGLLDIVWTLGQLAK